MISNFLKESIELELNVGELYQIFSVKFPEDKEFLVENFDGRDEPCCPD